MESTHRAFIEIREGEGMVVKGAGTVDLILLSPLSFKASTEIKALNQHDQIIRIDEIPANLGLSGFWIVYSTRKKGLKDGIVYDIPQTWSGEIIARECLRILKTEGYAENEIKLIGLTTSTQPES